jgi:hypothetical protein
VQGVEVFVTRRIYARGGALQIASKSALCNSGNDVGVIALLRMVISLWLVFCPIHKSGHVLPVAIFVLVLTSVYLTVRTRGPMCGGSDSMFFQVQLGLLAGSFGFLNPLLPKIGLGWIAAQGVLSYFLAGFSKFRNVRWRNGAAMRSLIVSEGAYVIFQPVRVLARSPAACVLIGWSVLVFELMFPLVLVLPMEGRLVLVCLGFAFHTVNAVVLGLNRFVWAWSATYPAVLYFGGL